MSLHPAAPRPTAANVDQGASDKKKVLEAHRLPCTSHLRLAPHAASTAAGGASPPFRMMGSQTPSWGRLLLPPATSALFGGDLSTPRGRRPLLASSPGTRTTSPASPGGLASRAGTRGPRGLQTARGGDPSTPRGRCAHSWLLHLALRASLPLFFCWAASAMALRCWPRAVSDGLVLEAHRPPCISHLRPSPCFRMMGKQVPSGGRLMLLPPATAKACTGGP